MLTKSLIAMAAAAAVLGAAPASAAQYFVVAPVLGNSHSLEVTLLGATLPEATYGAGYSAPLASYLKLENARQPDPRKAVWEVTGTLPDGLILNGSTVEGTPTEYGSKQIEVQVGYKGKQAQQAYGLNIKVPLAITPRTLTDGMTQNAYSQDLSDSTVFPPGPGLAQSNVVWSLKAGSTLPAGLVLSPNGVITGTPTAGFKGQITLLASLAGTTAEQTYDLSISNVDVAMADPQTPIARMLQAYTYDLKPLVSVQGDPHYDPAAVRFTATTPLPTGLTLSADGKITGAASGELIRSTPVTVNVSYKNHVAQKNFVLESRLIIKNKDGIRGWNTGASAVSCDEYRNITHSGLYEGDTGSGIYRVATSAMGALNVYCDMDRDGGGWTLLMKQASGDGTTLQGDTGYWSNGTVLNDNTANMNLNNGNFVSAAFNGLQVNHLRLQASNEASMQYKDLNQTSTAKTAFSDSQRIIYNDNVGDPGTTTYPHWFIHTTYYPNGAPITTSRFGFNIAMQICAARWGWVMNENPVNTAIGSHDVCGGLGAYGSAYGSTFMNNSKNALQPSALYLWGK